LPKTAPRSYWFDAFRNLSAQAEDILEHQENLCAVGTLLDGA
jgi:hypothetical protein